MNKEVEFAKTLEQVRNLAKEQGNVVSQEQIEDAFEKIGLSKEELIPIYEYLKQKKIGIGEPVDIDEYLTKEDKDYLSVYLDEINLLPSYSSGEREACFISALAGEKEAKIKLIEIMLPDVVDIAKLYAGQGVGMEDLIGEGNVALSMGVEMLGCLEDPKEVSGMLGKMIMDAMEDLISEDEKERKIDRKVVDKVNAVAKEAKELAESLQKKITVEELAEESGLSEKEIRDAIRISGKKIEYFEENE
ncbi:MAG: hypothetical protein ACI39N_06465 [Lachnospiraceae bacterium]